MSTIIPVDAGSLPVGFCPATFQAMLDGFSAVQTVTLSLGVGLGVQVQSAKPTNTTIPWLQLDSAGNPVRLYWFANGAWLSLHPLVTGMVMPWFGVLPTTAVLADGKTYLATFDGGDTLSIPSPLSGPMWEVVLDKAARVPLAVGTLPLQLITVGPDDTGGFDEVTIGISNMPPHSHTVPLFAGDSINHADHVNTTDENTVQNANYQTGIKGGNPDGSTSPLSNMPPYFGMNWIRRTGRTFYTVP